MSCPCTTNPIHAHMIILCLASSPQNAPIESIFMPKWHGSKALPIPYLSKIRIFNLSLYIPARRPRVYCSPCLSCTLTQLPMSVPTLRCHHLNPALPPLPSSNIMHHLTISETNNPKVEAWLMRQGNAHALANSNWKG